MPEPTESTVQVDPAIMAGMPVYPPAEPGTQRYFWCEDGDVDYTIVARDLEHAKEIMLTAGCDATNPDTGYSVRWKDATWLVWGEHTDPARIAKIRVRHDDDRGTSPDGMGWALDTYRPGDFCCSEY